MHSAIVKRLETARQKEAAARADEVLNAIPENRRFQQKIASVDAFIADGTPPRNSVATVLSNMTEAVRPHVIMHHVSEDRDAQRLAYFRFATQSFLVSHYELERLAAQKQINANFTLHRLSHGLAQLHSIGWHKEAAWLAEAVWSRAGHTLGRNGDVPSLMSNELFGWFMSYFTLGSRDLISAAGVTEPDDPDTAFSHLLGRWREEDGGGLENLMIAYAEQNIARSLMSFADAPADSIEKLWWYIPYDIYAIQQRRVSEGLDPVPLDDPRAAMPMTDLTDAPLVQDDLIWPAYLRACQEDGITPYNPRSTLQARTNRATLEVTLI